MNNIFEIIASLTECFIVVRFCNRFLGLKKESNNWIKSIMIFSLLAIDNILLSQLDGFENLSIVLLLIFIFLYAVFFLKGKIFEKMLISIVPTITALPINLIVIQSFSAFSGASASELTQPDSNMRIMVLFFSKFAFFIVCELLVRLRRNNEYSLNGFQWITQLSCFVVSFFISNSLWGISRVMSETQPQFLFIYIMIAVLNILMYVLLNKMQHDNIIKEKYRLAQVNLNAQEQLVLEAKERYAEIRTLRHDMKHCLTTAAELISDNKSNEAQKYIEQIINEKINSTVSGINTGSTVIDAVINRKISLCADRKIEFKCLIDTSLGDINEIDLSILLSNLLDNAITGCSYMKYPFIELKIGKRKAYTVIIVKNTINRSVLENNPELRTIQKNKSVHGFGIGSIRKIAEKYNGNVDFYEEDDFFIAEIWLEN